MTKISVSLNKHNEIIVNNGNLSKNTDKAYVCDVCGDILIVEPTYNKTFKVHHCSVCDDVINKCAHCEHLVEGQGGTWVCDKANKMCADVVLECVI